MKNTIKTITLALSIFCINQGFSQDTLHLDFKATQTVPDKVIEDKIVAWGKTLNGKKQDINIVAYYHKGEFKKFAEERLQEMFLSVNRKVRELVTIKTQEAKKGEDYQRTRVDIIHWAEGSDPKTMADKKKAEEKAAKEAEKKKKDEEEKLAKEAKDKEAKDKKGSSSSTTAKKDDKKEDKKAIDKKAEEAEKKAQEQRNKERLAKYGFRPTKSSGQGDMVKQSEVQTLKTAKIIIAQFGVKEIDDMMESSIKKFFTFNTNFDVMPYMEAKAEAKKDPDHVFVMFVTGVSSKSLPHDRDDKTTPLWKEQYRNISGGAFLVIENAKGGVMANCYLPSFEDGGITEEIVGFGCEAISSMLKTMDEKQMGSNLKLESTYLKDAPALKDKILYIPEGWLSPKFDKDAIKSIYTGQFEIVSYEKWRDAILNKEDVGYAIVVPKPVGGGYVYQHFLVNAKSGKVYAICYPRVATSASKSNTGYINEKNVKRYNDAILGTEEK
jgi:hypothetical protein